MKPKRTPGIYIHETKTFYYLEAGDNHVGNTLDRVKKALIQRGLIVYDLNTNYYQPSYCFVAIDTAEKNDYTIQPIFISEHIKKIYESKTTATKGEFK